MHTNTPTSPGSSDASIRRAGGHSTGITRRRWLAALAAIVLCFGTRAPAGADDGHRRGDDAQ